MIDKRDGIGVGEARGLLLKYFVFGAMKHSEEYKTAVSGENHGEYTLFRIFRFSLKLNNVLVKV